MVSNFHLTSNETDDGNFVSLFLIQRKPPMPHVPILSSTLVDGIVTSSEHSHNLIPDKEVLVGLADGEEWEVE